MTAPHVPDAARRDSGSFPKWLLWPITFALAVAGALGFYNDAVEADLLWLYWCVVCLLIAFYVVLAAVYLTRLLRWGWRRWNEFAGKARMHDDLATELTRWTHAAGTALARAEDAEALVAGSRLDALREGRRRTLAEIRASAGRTFFRDIEVAVAEGVLVIGAKWSDDIPQVDSRYVLRSATLNQPKAVLESVEIRENGIVVFRVASVASDAYRVDLLARASATGTVLTDVEIVARTDSLEEEAIWPEN